MVYRKGELSKSAVDRGWPHQVALESRLCGGDNYIKLRMFCESLSLCDRGHSFYRDKRDFSVFCFASRDDAVIFQHRFGGEPMCPKTRPKWPAG